ncbi:hypothetical protein [Desulfovibrio sp. ZJ369]|uniref:hypothetical protein n=1 Tax=Desulfovibrio sp. ZJ369 TaxID=2709793 RepID=UPI0013E9EAED|nr:hypothetical protein [Desulfovibrio sp. ZJ369]
METSSLNFSGLSDEQIILVASQLSAATCASLPCMDDEAQAFERVQRLFDQHCQDLLKKRAAAVVLVSAGMDLG